MKTLSAKRRIAHDENGLSDVYDVLAGFHVSNPALQEAIAKLLLAGEDSKYAVDLAEAQELLAKAQAMQPAGIRAEQLGKMVTFPDPIILDGTEPQTLSDLLDDDESLASGKVDDPGAWVTQANPLPAEAITRPVAIGGGWQQTRPYVGLAHYEKGRRFTKSNGNIKAIILEAEEGGPCRLWIKHDSEAFMPLTAAHYQGHIGNCFTEGDKRLKECRSLVGGDAE